jgi:hypothetical protein
MMKLGEIEGKCRVALIAIADRYSANRLFENWLRRKAPEPN